MNTQFCFIKGELPSRDTLQSAITDLELEFKLQLEPEFNLNEDEGFSPCSIDGFDDIGFELECGKIEDILEESDEFEPYLEDRTNYIAMSWGGSFGDCLCVMIVTLALMKYFNAVTTYDFEISDTIKDIEETIQSCLKELQL
ncbi:hypothetical protein KO495_00775 [Colwellia sp. D2M02]|uniref:hypothetical protein n=1 Tax=Colwellia sp. D2M02 TaxID=2841562 RepID=UPI001C090512|nr:hypothetical protein [Colwellia sp. D2M02]MBU2891851.1 hypothetical protein [Colwellia sp. D2M02]